MSAMPTGSHLHSSRCFLFTLLPLLFDVDSLVDNAEPARRRTIETTGVLLLVNLALALGVLVLRAHVLTIDQRSTKVKSLFI